jgi:hypothetical protein
MLANGYFLSQSQSFHYSTFQKPMQSLLPVTIPLKKASLLLLLLPLLMSCEDSLDKLYPETSPVQLPAATQVGSNTFGCSLNGQVWEASNATTLRGNVLTPTATFQHGVLQIDAFRRLQVSGPITNFHFTLSQVTGPGVYSLSQSQPGRLVRLKSAGGLVEYTAKSQRPGTLTITRLDTAGAHPFVAGRFELRAEPLSGSRMSGELPAEVQVREGRFDIQLNR